MSKRWESERVAWRKGGKIGIKEAGRRKKSKEGSASFCQAFINLSLSCPFYPRAPVRLCGSGNSREKSFSWREKRMSDGRFDRLKLPMTPKWVVYQARIYGLSLRRAKLEAHDALSRLRQRRLGRRRGRDAGREGGRGWPEEERGIEENKKVKKGVRKKCWFGR